MFRSVKLKNIKITVVCVLGVLLLLAACFPVLRSAAPDTVMIGDKPYPLQAEDSSDVEAFLTACGYKHVFVTHTPSGPINLPDPETGTATEDENVTPEA